MACSDIKQEMTRQNHALRCTNCFTNLRLNRIPTLNP